MPTFDTPGPVSAEIDLPAGDIRMIASDRTDTVVEVRPSDSTREADVRVAEQTRAEYSAGRLLVRAPRPRGLGLFGRPGSVDVTIELPTGSSVQADAGISAFRSTGRLGLCRIKTGVGSIECSDTGPLDLSTGAGPVAVDRVAGHAEVSTSSGRVRLGAIDGTAVIKNSNGDNWIGEITGDLRVATANGAITIGHAGAGVNASSANGDIRVAEVTRGSATLKTAFGQIEIGIRPGTAARLDVSTKFGRILNDLDDADGPGPSDETAEVRALTSYGDIVIHRS